MAFFRKALPPFSGILASAKRGAEAFPGGPLRLTQPLAGNFCGQGCGFFGNKYYICRIPTLFPRFAERRAGMDIHKKALLGRLVFDDVRTSQLQIVSQGQSNEDAPWDVCNRPFGCPVAPFVGNGAGRGTSIGISVGLSALLVSTNGAMRRPLHRGTGDKYGSPRFSCT